MVISAGTVDFNFDPLDNEAAAWEAFASDVYLLPRLRLFSNLG